MATLLFAERQRFRHWFIWLLITPGPISLVWVIIALLTNNPIVGDAVIAFVLLAFAVVCGIGLPLFMYTIGLDTEVRETGVYIKFKPFHRKWIPLNFEDIFKVEAVTYSPIKEYGGWGIRYGRKGKAYNVSGNKGLFVTLRNGRNIMIGSGNHEELYNLVSGRLK